MSRNIAKPFKMELSLINISTLSPKYKCFYGEDVELFITVKDENNQPVDLTTVSVKIFFINEGEDLRQDEGITIVDAVNGRINAMVKKKYIRLGNNVVRVAIFDDDQEVYLQPFQITCIDTEVVDDNSDIVGDDDVNIKDEFSKVRKNISDLDTRVTNEVETLNSSLDTIKQEKADNTKVDNVQQQVNNLVLGAVGDGNNAEVIQARGGYATLNEKIDTNLNKLFTESCYSIKNVMSTFAWENGYVGTDGAIVSGTNSITSEKIKLEYNTTLILTPNLNLDYRYAIYNSDGTVTRSDYITTDTTISGGKTIRVTIRNTKGVAITSSSSIYMFYTKNIGKTEIAIDKVNNFKLSDFDYYGNRLSLKNISFKAGSTIKATKSNLKIAIYFTYENTSGWLKEYKFTSDLTPVEIRLKYDDDTDFVTGKDSRYFVELIDDNSLIKYKDVAKYTNSKNVAYVSTTGSDSNEGTSEHPFATLQKAITNGYTNINIVGGTYKGQVINASYLEEINIKCIGTDKAIFDNSKDLTYAVENNLCVSTTTFPISSNWYKFFIGKTIDLEHDVIGGRPISMKAYNVILFEITGDIKNDYCLKPVTSLELCKNEEGTFYYDGTKIYINPLNGLYTNTYKYQINECLDQYTNHTFNFSNINKFNVENIEVLYATNNGFNIVNSNGDFKNCNSHYSCGNEGFTTENSHVVFKNCNADRNHVDGFGFRGKGVNDLYNCNASYNFDDGCSHHDDTTGTIYGGDWHHNGKGGISPAHGASVDLYNCFTHDNELFGIYSEASRNLGRKQKYSNCVCYNNPTDIKVNGFHVISYNTKYSTKDILVNSDTSFTEL